MAQYRIQHIADTNISLGPVDSGTCFGCMNTECTSQRLIIIKKPAGQHFSVGQIVETEVPKKTFVYEFFFAIFVPIIGFITIFSFMRLLAIPENKCVLAGVCGFFIIAFLYYWIRKQIPPKTALKIK
ncbi:hypothetical protein FACS1894172_18240 [Spirochaetia bacterium]|nr:hypothetical protein FACS1894164_16980 [Spirochaetia bacterium]GHU35896.1 hypothetical protein FACS1894172_18240 [Spirochaetia bacterium]